MKIKLVELKYELKEDLPKEYTKYLRGFFANKFSNTLFHQHTKEGNFRYKYPLIQYKIIDGKPVIFGINKGAELIISKFLDINSLSLNHKEYKKISSQLLTKEFDLEVNEGEIYEYQFEEPWLALNKKNYNKYIKMNTHEREKLLKRVLVGNFLSMASGLDWWVEEDINVENLKVDEVLVEYKRNKLLAFKGAFKSNICLPSNIGIGKGSSKGYGRIIRK